jgi:hypothetical protein
MFFTAQRNAKVAALALRVMATVHEKHPEVIEAATTTSLSETFPQTQIRLIIADYFTAVSELKASSEGAARAGAVKGFRLLRRLSPFDRFVVGDNDILDHFAQLPDEGSAVAHWLMSSDAGPMGRRVRRRSPRLLVR